MIMYRQEGNSVVTELAVEEALSMIENLSKSLNHSLKYTCHNFTTTVVLEDQGKFYPGSFTYVVKK